MGNHQAAIDDFLNAIKEDPNYALSYFHMGVSQLKLRMYNEAISCFENAKDYDTQDNPAVFDGMGCCYHR